MTIELAHTFCIECAHSLPGLGVSTMHGHSYWVTVYVESSAENPIPMDILTGYCAMLRCRLDHKNLNDVLPQPTMESIAKWVAENIQGPRPTRVRVSRPSINVAATWNREG